MSKKDDVILNRFLVSVYENCKKQRSVQYYANEQNLSPYYFSSIIREKSGKSALQWIGNITMIFSRQYLKCSDMSIKEIADCLNFPDQSPLRDISSTTKDVRQWNFETEDCKTELFHN